MYIYLYLLMSRRIYKYEDIEKVESLDTINNFFDNKNFKIGEIGEDGERVNEISDLFRKSMISVVPSIPSSIGHVLSWLYPLWILTIFFLNTICHISIMHSLIIDGLFILISAVGLHIGAYIFLKDYIHKMDPIKFWQRYVGGKNALFFIEHEGKIVAFGGLQESSMKNNQSNGWLTYMFVHPEYLGQGLGSRIMLECYYYGKKFNFGYISGGTSSLQTGQIQLQKKVVDIIHQLGLKCDFKIEHQKKHWWEFVYTVTMTYSIP